MVKIHWSVYLTLGAAVLFFSNRLNTQTSSKDFTIFIWAGYLLLTIGVSKLVFWFISRKKEIPFEKREVKKEIYSSQRYCRRCGNPLNGNEHFCPKCGQRQMYKF